MYMKQTLAKFRPLQLQLLRLLSLPLNYTSLFLHIGVNRCLSLTLVWNMHPIHLIPSSILLCPLPLQRQIRMTLQRLPQIVHTMPIMTVLHLIHDHISEACAVVLNSYEESEVVAADNAQAVELMVKCYGVNISVWGGLARCKVVFRWLVDKNVATAEWKN